MRYIWLIFFMFLSSLVWSHSVTDTLELPELRGFLLQHAPSFNTNQGKAIKSDARVWYPAFFCRMEHLCEKETGIGSKFRLGSIDYVNYLEDK